MRILINIVVILILPLLFIGNSYVDEAKYKPINSTRSQKIIDAKKEKYCNSRFNFCLVYSSTLLPIQSTSANNDGLKLFTENRKGKVTVVGAHNIFDWTPKELLEFNVENILPKQSENAVVVSKLFNVDYYQIHLAYAEKSILQEAYFKDGNYILFTIETAANHPELLDELKETTALEFHKNG
jgi:hypothetical protein